MGVMCVIRGVSVYGRDMRGRVWELDWTAGSGVLFGRAAGVYVCDVCV